MTDSDVNSDSTSSSSIELVISPIIDVSRELRTKSQNECSTSGRPNAEPACASPLGVVVGLGNALGVPVYDQYRTMLGLAERYPELFPPGEPSSSRPVRVVERGETSVRPTSNEVVVSSVDSDEVDSVVRALEESDEESTTIEPEEDEDREDPPEVIPKELDEDGLADL